MLLKLSIRDCLSYAGEETFSLEAANLRKQHPDHVIRRGEDEAVRLAMIYGGNATGKSNLIKAVQLFIRAFRSNDCQPLSANRFALGGEALEPPRFAFTFHGSRSRYRYSVTLGNEGIAEERLEWLKVGTDEATPLFSRAAGKATAFDEALAGEWYTWRTLAPNMSLLREFEEDGIRTEDIPGKAHLIEALDFLGRFRFGLQSPPERGYLNGLYGSLPILNGFFGSAGLQPRTVSEHSGQKATCRPGNHRQSHRNGQSPATFR